MADDVFIPVNTQIDVYLKDIKDLFLCLQLEQAKYYLDIIYKAIENGNLEVEDAQKIDILAIYSFVTVYNGEEKMAYLYCKKMSDIEYLRHDKERLIEYYYIAALVNLQSGQKNLAISSIEEGMKLTSDTNNNNALCAPAALHGCRTPQQRPRQAPQSCPHDGWWKDGAQ